MYCVESLSGMGYMKVYPVTGESFFIQVARLAQAGMLTAKLLWNGGIVFFPTIPFNANGEQVHITAWDLKATYIDEEN